MMTEFSGGVRTSWSSRHVLLAALFASATLALVYVLHARPAEFELRLELKSRYSSVVQLYFDTGAGFNERESIKLKVRATRDFRTVTFPIPAQRVNHLRFDPPPGRSELSIRAAALRTARKQIPIAPDRFHPLSEIDQLERTDAVLVVRTTPAANDPQIAIDVAEPAAGDVNATKRVVGTALLLMLVTAALAIAKGTPELRVSDALHSLLFFPALCTVVALALSIARINGSSSAALLDYFPRADRDTGVLAGTAHAIRADEWMVHTPWLFSQVRHAQPFSAYNPSVGGGHAALLCNLPVAHWSMAFRPEFWAFLIGVRFDVAFAFFWNLKWCLLACGTYTLLLVITGSDPFISAAGALILLFSSTIQWWFSTPTLMPDMIGWSAFGVAAAYRTVTGTRLQRVVCTAGFVFAAMAFVCCCYPRFQVPLATAAVPLFVVLVQNSTAQRRWLEFSIGGAAIILLSTFFLWQTRETLRAIAVLSYPGRVVSQGAGEGWSSILRGFLTLDLSDDHFPKTFPNVVEASSFLNPLPLLVMLQVFRRREMRRVDAVQVTLLLTGVGMLGFAICGVPAWLARITFWSYVTSQRVVVPLDVVAVLALCRELSQPARSFPRLVLLGAGTLTFALALYATNHALGDFSTILGVIAIGAYFSSAGVLIAARRRAAAGVAICLPVILTGAGVNPLTRALPAYRAPHVAHAMEDLAHRFPRARWIVLGDYPLGSIISSLFRTTGSEVLTGTIAVPNPAFLHALDPQGISADVYSRYAAVAVVPGTDHPRFKLDTPAVSYTIELPLTEKWLSAAGIDGIVAPNAPQLAVPHGYSEVVKRDNWRFWLRSTLLREQSD